MGKAERRTLQDFLAEQEGPGPYEIRLDNFWDVNDEANPDDLDRAVISTYDPDSNVSYSGAVVIDFGDDPTAEHAWRVKMYFRSAWSTRDVLARICVPAKPGELPTLMLPEGDVELPEYPGEAA